MQESRQFSYKVRTFLCISISFNQSAFKIGSLCKSKMGPLNRQMRQTQMEVYFDVVDVDCRRSFTMQQILLATYPYFYHLRTGNLTSVLTEILCTVQKKAFQQQYITIVHTLIFQASVVQVGNWVGLICWVFVLCLLLNDGAKRIRLPYLKIMYTAIRKILHLQEMLYIQP